MESKYLHNEVLLVGRIMNRQKGYRCNNKKSIRVKLAIPNDDNYELNPNTAYVYFYEDDQCDQRASECACYYTRMYADAGLVCKRCGGCDPECRGSGRQFF